MRILTKLDLDSLLQVFFLRKQYKIIAFRWKGYSRCWVHKDNKFCPNYYQEFGDVYKDLWSCVEASWLYCRLVNNGNLFFCTLTSRFTDKKNCSSLTKKILLMRAPSRNFYFAQVFWCYFLFVITFPRTVKQFSVVSFLRANLFVLLDHLYNMSFYSILRSALN